MTQPLEDVMAFTNMGACFVEDIPCMPSQICQGQSSEHTMAIGDVPHGLRLLLVLSGLLLQVRFERKLKDFGEVPLMLCAWIDNGRNFLIFKPDLFTERRSTSLLFLRILYMRC